jgi:hypothetical protein
MRQRLRARPTPTTSLVKLARHRSIAIPDCALIDHATEFYAITPNPSYCFLTLPNSIAMHEGRSRPDQLYGLFASRFAKDRRLPESLIEDEDFERWLRRRAEELGS